jgi:hypothetical protein
VELEAVRLLHVDEHGVGLREPHEFGITGIMRVRQDHLVAALEQGAEEQQHGRRRPRSDEDLVGRDAHPVARLVVLGDGLAQGQDAEGVRVAGAPVLEGLLGGFADDRRRLEVGLAELEMDHVGPLALEGLGALEHLHGQEGLDLLRPAGDHPPASRAARAIRRRAATICASMRGPSLSTPTLEPG